MLTVAMVCRVSPEFDLSHASRLARQVSNHIDQPHRIVCLTDAAGTAVRDRTGPEGERYVALKHDWPGWWSMLEMYRIAGPVLYMDLDTTVVGDITPLARIACQLDSRTVLMLKPFANLKSPKFRTGIVAWGAESRVASTYWAMEDAVASGGTFEPSYVQEGMTRAGAFKRGLNNGAWKNDEEWAVDRMGRSGMKIRSIQDVLPGFVASYKLHVKTGRADNPSIICYHGRPRPWEVETDAKTVAGCNAS